MFTDPLIRNQSLAAGALLGLFRRRARRCSGRPCCFSVNTARINWTYRYAVINSLDSNPRRNTRKLNAYFISIILYNILTDHRSSTAY